MVHTYGAQGPHHCASHHRGYRGQGEGAPPASAPAARIVRWSVHERQVGDHELKCALRAEQQPRKADDGAGQWAVGSTILCEMYRDAATNSDVTTAGGNGARQHTA